jgi:hypothetical protein
MIIKFGMDVSWQRIEQKACYEPASQIVFVSSKRFVLVLEVGWLAVIVVQILLHKERPPSRDRDTEPNDDLHPFIG